MPRFETSEGWQVGLSDASDFVQTSGFQEVRVKLAISNCGGLELKWLRTCLSDPGRRYAIADIVFQALIAGGVGVWLNIGLPIE